MRLLLNRKTGMAKSKSFSSVASSVWNKLPGHLSSISTLPAFRKRLKHHLFLSASSGNPSPSTGITFCDWCQPIHRCDSGQTHPHRLANLFQLSAYDQSTSPPESRLHTGARVNFVLLTYLLTSPHIPEHCPFRVQTQLIHIILYTFSPSLPTPTCTSHPCHHISTGQHQIISTLRFQMPKPPPPSATLWTPKDRTNPHCASYPSATPHTSISPSSVPSSPDFADLLSSSPRFQTFHTFDKVGTNNVSAYMLQNFCLQNLSIINTNK